MHSHIAVVGIIYLCSNIATQPMDDIRKVMASAKAGGRFISEDATVNDLQDRVADQCYELMRCA